jgi:ABC transport system ATP-binding/permease protein
MSSPAVNLVNLERAVKAYGQRPLLDGVSAGVAAGDRIGIVGRNGAGKSTLLSVLAGTEALDSGRATRTRGLRTGVLAQRTELTGTVASNVVGDLPEHAWAANPRTRSVLAALLPGIDLAGPADRLSGGESRRVALAAVLIGDHDLLLLDEPTNHLDVEAIDWLAQHLAGRPEALVAVTHDRWFLDAVCNRTWELADGQVHAYEGGYSAYVLARAERARVAEATDRRRRNLLRKELAWLRRGPPARTSKPRFRVDAANALIEGEPPPRDGVELTRMATARLGRTVIEAEDVTATVPPGANGPRTLLRDVTWQLGPGERVGLIGPNGSGKSTLLDLLAGVGDPDEPAETGGSGEAGPGLDVTGEIIRGKTVRLGYLHQRDAGLDPALTPREAVTEVRGTLDSAQGAAAASQLLDRLGLRGDTQWTPARELSGGERRRLQLLRILIDEPNVLFLDEPTNDLDVDTLTELEDLLDGWPGSLVLVSHDRYFLERVTDHVVALLGDGDLSFLPGGVDEYLRRRSAGAGAATRPGAAATGTRPADAGGAASGEVAGAGQPGAGQPGGSQPGGAGAQRAARKDMQRLERQIDRLTRQEEKLTVALAEHATDYVRLTELGAELRAVQDEKSRLEEQWLEAAEET